MPNSEIEKNKFSKIEEIFDNFTRKDLQNYFKHQKEFDSLLTNLKDIFKIAFPIDIKTPDQKDDPSSPFLVDKETYEKMVSDSSFKIQKVESLLEDFATSIAQNLNSVDTSLLDQDNYENLLRDFFAILSDQLTEEVEIQIKRGRKPQEYIEPRLVFFANLAEKFKLNNPSISQRINSSLEIFLYTFRQNYHHNISFKKYRDRYQIKQSELSLRTEPSWTNAAQDPNTFEPDISLPDHLNLPNLTSIYQTSELPNIHEENSNLRQQISELYQALYYANDRITSLNSTILYLQQQINIQALTPEQYEEIFKREISKIAEEFSKAGQEISNLFSKKLGDTQKFVNASFHQLIESNLDSFTRLLNFFSQTDQKNQANFQEIRNELAEIKRNQENGITDQQRREESEEDGIAKQTMMQELMQQNSQILELLETLIEKLDNSRKEIQELQDRNAELEKDNIAKQQTIQELQDLIKELRKDNIAKQQTTQELQDRNAELEAKKQSREESEEDGIAKQQMIQELLDRIKELEELNAKLTTDKKTSDYQEKENVTSDKKDSTPTDSSLTASQHPQPVVIYPPFIESKNETIPSHSASPLRSLRESRSSSPD